MSDAFKELNQHVSAKALLGYLNFSDGAEDPRWQQEFSNACSLLINARPASIHESLQQWLMEELHRFHETESAFRDITQAQTVLKLLPETLQAYRQYHDFLLAHLTPEEMFQPFFLARTLEAILAEEPNGRESAEVIQSAVKRLNDYVGYRPLPILETRPEAEPYPHERFRPIPLYIRNVGAAPGHYQELIEQTIHILSQTDSDILYSAHFEFDLLDELAMDVRAYDQRHPANRRPNYLFGEWDPHHLDDEGRHRRLIARQVVLDALLQRVNESKDAPREELLFESSAVLAGTLLMATGVSGRSPTAHDASQSLGVLIPTIAQYRDAFYAQLISKLPNKHRQRLEVEQKKTHQPFGGVRQFLNTWMGRHRARQLQHRFLSLLFAEMGYPEASREEAQRIPTASVRALSEILSHLSAGRRELKQGQLKEVAARVPKIDSIVHHGIDCGAIVDPWNILAFQGLFPFSSAQMDSTRDPRVRELLQIIDQILNLLAQLSGESAARGQEELTQNTLAQLKSFSDWWDQFASVEVSDVQRVSGAEAYQSAQSVSAALAHWHQQEEGKADLAFWREHLESFHSPKAFALVTDALLQKKDYRAAMALLINWIGNVEEAPLQDGQFSFHSLVIRWMLEVTKSEDSSQDQHYLATRFFELLEANAEDYWEVPSLQEPELLPPPTEEGPIDQDEDPEDLYSAAYEEVTYKDSTSTADDEGAVVDGPADIGQHFSLEGENENIEKRLRFMTTLAQLWQIGARTQGIASDHLESWLATTQKKRLQLLTLLDAIHRQAVPAPLGSYDSLVEYDQRRVLKEQLLNAGINTALQLSLALGSLRARLPESSLSSSEQDAPSWEAPALQLEQAFLNNNVDQAKYVLPDMLKAFRKEKLLTPAQSEQSSPRQLLQSRLAQTVLHAILVNLPRLGLLHETWQFLKLAHEMEREQVGERQDVSEMGRLFKDAFHEVMECFAHSLTSWQSLPDDPRQLELLNDLSTPFLRLWSQHCRSVQLSPIESIRDEKDWQQLSEFVQRYGRELFHARFMTIANLRGILLQGVDHWLSHLQDNPEALGGPTERETATFDAPTIPLIEDLDKKIPRKQAVKYLEIILHGLVTHYQEYLDYNTTSARSDYGENLYVLLDQLRVKIAYDRQAWQLLPLMISHEVLAKHRVDGLTRRWEDTLKQLTEQPANQFLQRLAVIEQKTGTRLNTIRDRLEERFVKPLIVDRLRALIEPAMNEAGEETFAAFQHELRKCTQVPTGSGLDVPMWLHRLEDEVQRVQNSRSEIATLAENAYRSEPRTLSLEELQTELARWK